jgi:hypothetical protein
LLELEAEGQERQDRVDKQVAKREQDVEHILSCLSARVLCIVLLRQQQTNDACRAYYLYLLLERPVAGSTVVRRRLVEAVLRVLVALVDVLELHEAQHAGAESQGTRHAWNENSTEKGSMNCSVDDRKKPIMAIMFRPA